METASASALVDMRMMGVESAAPVGETLPLIVADVDVAQLRALQASPRFDEVLEDRIAVASLAESAPLIEAPQV